jgi:hypothetical protein
MNWFVLSEVGLTDATSKVGLGCANPQTTATQKAIVEMTERGM